MPFTATSAEYPISFLIEHQCPQCGAPAVLEESHRLFRCRFCRVQSYIVSSGVFRYAMTPRSARTRDLIHFPFWRFKGMLFACSGEGITSRFLDTSQQATGSTLFPPSLGLRSQTQKLKLLSPDIQGRFIKPAISLNQCLGTIIPRHSARLKQPVYHQAAIGETVHLIYAPFYQDTSLFDAITNDILSSGDLELLDRIPSRDTPPGNSIQLIPTLCPGCGWDLNGSPDSIILSCGNCDTFWQPKNNGLSQVNVATVPSQDTGDIFLPFWRIKADVSGVDLGNWEEMARIANLPVVPARDWKECRFHFWCPAFKARPDKFIQIASRTTLAQTKIRLEKSLPGTPRHPVNLALSEAVETAKLILADIMRPQAEMMPRLNGITIRPRTGLLAYLPFHQGHHEFIGRETGIAINRAMLDLSVNL